MDARAGPAHVPSRRGCRPRPRWLRRECRALGRPPAAMRRNGASIWARSSTVAAHARPAPRPPTTGTHRIPFARRGGGVAAGPRPDGPARRRRQGVLRGQALFEMAPMSLEDGLVMQLHPGSRRNHNRLVHTLRSRHGRRHPRADELRRRAPPLLDRFGNDARFRLVLFTLDETTFTRELAPLAGHYPALPRTTVVVPRQRRGHAPLPPRGDRDRRLREHVRLHRRHPCVPVDPGAS